jgi:hypothetical protein
MKSLTQLHKLSTQGEIHTNYIAGLSEGEKELMRPHREDLLITRKTES